MTHISKYLPIVFLTLLVACASNVDKPESLLAEAELSLNQASSAEAPQHVPAVYQSAEQHLTMARQSIDENEYRLAALALEKSIADSKYAIIKANAVKSETAATQVAESLQALKEETIIQ